LRSLKQFRANTDKFIRTIVYVYFSIQKVSNKFSLVIFTM